MANYTDYPAQGRTPLVLPASLPVCLLNPSSSESLAVVAVRRHSIPRNKELHFTRRYQAAGTSHWSIQANKSFNWLPCDLAKGKAVLTAGWIGWSRTHKESPYLKTLKKQEHLVTPMWTALFEAI